MQPHIRKMMMSHVLMCVAHQKTRHTESAHSWTQILGPIGPVSTTVSSLKYGLHKVSIDTGWNASCGNRFRSVNLHPTFAHGVCVQHMDFLMMISQPPLPAHTSTQQNGTAHVWTAIRHHEDRATNTKLLYLVQLAHGKGLTAHRMRMHV